MIKDFPSSEIVCPGTPPDVILFSSETFSQFKNRLYTIPYAAYSERAYRDTNIDGAQIFLSKDGITALPLAVDPIVTYYNKDLLASANFVIPPATWSAVTKSVPIFTKHTTNGGISQVAIALGTDQNVTNVRDILSTLFLQTGSPIVSYNASTGKNVSELAGANINSNAQALAFYTSFANPSNTNYSWNNSLPSSLQMFLAGKSAYYIGRASELFTIQAQNPNLNFDVAPIFQPDGAPRQITFGSFVAVGVMKNAPNFAAAYAAASAFATAGAIDTISKQFSIPPVRRDLLQIQQNNPYISVFFRAALAAFSWPDPDPAVTEKIFRGMITSVNSGKTDAQGAIYDADTSLQSSIR